MPVVNVKLKKEFPFQAIQFTGDNFMEIARFLEYNPNPYRFRIAEKQIDFSKPVNDDVPTRNRMYVTDWLVRQHSRYYLFTDPYFTSSYDIIG